MKNVNAKKDVMGYFLMNLIRQVIKKLGKK